MRVLFSLLSFLLLSFTAGAVSLALNAGERGGACLETAAAPCLMEQLQRETDAEIARVSGLGFRELRDELSSEPVTGSLPRENFTTETMTEPAMLATISDAEYRDELTRAITRFCAREYFETYIRPLCATTVVLREQLYGARQGSGSGAAEPDPVLLVLAPGIAPGTTRQDGRVLTPAALAVKSGAMKMTGKRLECTPNEGVDRYALYLYLRRKLPDGVAGISHFAYFLPQHCRFTLLFSKPIFSTFKRALSAVPQSRTRFCALRCNHSITPYGAIG